MDLPNYQCIPRTTPSTFPTYMGTCEICSICYVACANMSPSKPSVGIGLWAVVFEPPVYLFMEDLYVCCKWHMGYFGSNLPIPPVPYSQECGSLIQQGMQLVSRLLPLRPTAQRHIHHLFGMSVSPRANPVYGPQMSPRSQEAKALRALGFCPSSSSPASSSPHT